MGFFDIFKKSSPEDKNRKLFRRIKTKTDIPEVVSVMNDLIKISPHNDSYLDENPNGIGEFGLTKTNPIPVNGVDNINAYMDKLRYRFDSKIKEGRHSFNPIEFIRTTDSDNSEVGSSMPSEPLPASSIESPNIQGPTDVYNIYKSVSENKEKLTKIFINVYSLKTSNKVPKGFHHRDEIDILRDSKILLELEKN
jgi:hypothetical protein